jgi:mono/diheme cytochrome c family protein
MPNAASHGGRWEQVDMSKHIWLQIIAVVLLCIGALLFFRLHSAGGQPRPGAPASRGEELVRAWCLQCHTVGGPGAILHPEFDLVAIARMPSTTQMSLRAFLQSSHRDMPNLILTPQDRDDIIGYILSLRRE